MSSIFRKDDNYVDKPKRNTFDLSHQNNFTLKFGNLVPVLCQSVVPGDSFRIDPKFALRYMPQVFPVQTRQRASVKFYYVRNRNLWKDWMDFIGKTKSGLTPPYIKFDVTTHVNALRPSGLFDYLGVNPKIVVPYGSDKKFKLQNQVSVSGAYIPQSNVVLSNSPNSEHSIITRKNVRMQLAVPRAYNISVGNNEPSGFYSLESVYGGIAGISSDIVPVPYTADMHGGRFDLYNNGVTCKMYRKAWIPVFPFSVSVDTSIEGAADTMLVVRLESGEDVAIRVGNGLTITSSNIEYQRVGRLNLNIATFNGTIKYVVGYIMPNPDVKFNSVEISVLASANPELCWCDVSMAYSPFCSSSNTNGVRLSALPARAISSVYNALIRNAENNPFLVNGQPEYNKYLLSVEGGAISAEEMDDICYLKRCNWADDRFTTALPSPQQGNAPLVGLTGVNGATVHLGNADGTTAEVHLQVDSDTGNVVMVDGASGSSNNAALTHAFLSAVDFGISINDLRNVNSFQRWLENNIRRGYKYKDQLMAHYGVNARFDVLDMPEFIGGISRDVNVEQVTQTVKNEYGELGEYGGQSYIMGDGQAIEHYCDEHGFIIGLMSVYPLPLYQDALPKYFTQSDVFDYYFPEFSKIGMQPIVKSELAFSQAFNEGKSDEVFGYQRAWYDYLENLDSVHGNFRFDLRNFLLSRDFASTPSLNPDFLTVSSDDVNNTFYSDDDEDKIIGQIFFNMSAKRPIPMVGVPALE